MPWNRADTVFRSSNTFSNTVVSGQTLLASQSLAVFIIVRLSTRPMFRRNPIGAISCFLSIVNAGAISRWHHQDTSYKNRENVKQMALANGLYNHGDCISEILHIILHSKCLLGVRVYSVCMITYVNLVISTHE
jgi:hypothetical protein